jgi:ElaB/YqjD/DUF883 family membrane-anchored ribosome-binding protein
VAALEDQVVGTVQTAANTLTDTVDAVKEFVTSAPETVSETVENVVSAVKERVGKTFDISSRVQNNPWSAVGISVGLGFLAAYVFTPRQKPAVASSSEASPARTSLESERALPSSSSREPGLLDDLIVLVGSKVKEMAQNAVDMAAVAINNNIRENVPRLIDGAAKLLVAENRESNGTSFDAGKRIYGR